MDHQGEPLLSCNLEFQTGSSFAEKPGPVKAINNWQQSQSKTPSKSFTVDKVEEVFHLGEILLPVVVTTMQAKLSQGDQQLATKQDSI